MIRSSAAPGNKSIIKHLLILAIAAALALPSLGCGYLIAGGAGAAGGYILRDEGYKVQSPVTKDEKAKSDSESKSQ